MRNSHKAGDIKWEEGGVCRRQGKGQNLLKLDTNHCDWTSLTQCNEIDFIPAIKCLNFRLDIFATR